MPANRSQYCAYRHFAGELRGDAATSLIAMFTAYFDDSGTDGNSDIAVAACYISTKRGWDDFVEAWDRARWEEGFDAFHMAHFIAKSEMGHKPFCDWGNTKKDHVYQRLAKIINENKRIGVAVAVPKDVWDQTPERIRRHYGREHYTFAVRMCITQIVQWRKRSQIKLPMRYVFDWEMEHTEKRREISKVLEIISRVPLNQPVADLLGLEIDGYGFEHKEKFKPLQAADILAWQMRSHMRKIWPLGHDDKSLRHPGFATLIDQEVDLGFFTKEQIDKFVAQNDEFVSQGHPLPMIYD